MIKFKKRNFLSDVRLVYEKPLDLPTSDFISDRREESTKYLLKLKEMSDPTNEKLSKKKRKSENEDSSDVKVSKKKKRLDESSANEQETTTKVKETLIEAANGTDDSEISERKKSKKKKNVVDSVGEEKEIAADDTQPIIGRRRTRSMSDTEVVTRFTQTAEEFRTEHQITINGMSDDGRDKFISPAPMLKFSDTPYGPQILKCFEIAGFESPTPTQAQAWPIALAGRDVIVVAKTGSGKTCGFLLPAIHRLLNASTPRVRGPPAMLVLAPTRELACQIEEECVKFGRTSNMRSTCCYGGAPKGLQIRKIQSGIEILIATPGRLNDLIEMGVVNLSSVTFLVLDEADRMLDMGFEPQIRTIIAKLTPNRQSMMFTATWPREVQTLAREFLRNPVELRFGDIHSLNANKAITQHIRVITQLDKDNQLKQILKEINPSEKPENVPKTIIFVSRKSSCDQLANELWNMGYYADSIHGDREQFQRTKVMDQFKKGIVHILVATDVAARGLDVKDIQVVINYDFPAGNRLYNICLL